MGKPVVHFEIGCENLTETVKFYKNIFNWSINTHGNLAAIDSKIDNGISGHITNLVSEIPNHITFYIETKMIKEDLKLIESKGGKTLVNPIVLPDGRIFAWFQDIAGNTVGLITPLSNS